MKDQFLNKYTIVGSILSFLLGGVLSLYVHQSGLSHSKLLHEEQMKQQYLEFVTNNTELFFSEDLEDQRKLRAIVKPLRNAYMNAVLDSYKEDDHLKGIMKKLVIEEMLLRLTEGEKYHIPEVGTFSTSIRMARSGRNPKTGQTIHIPEKTMIKFKPSKILSDQVQNTRTRF